MLLPFGRAIQAAGLVKGKSAPATDLTDFRPISQVIIAVCCHNDEIEIYVEKRHGGLVLTDDGYTIADLEGTGMSFETEKRKAHLQSILSRFFEKLCDGRRIPST